MLISTINRTLHVLQIIRHTQSMVTYVCTDVSESEQESYILNGFLQPEAYQKLIPFILEQKKIFFTDFIEYFSEDGIFYLLFRYHKGIHLTEQLKNSDMIQRLEYARCLIEQMVLQDMPLLFQYTMLLPEQVLITEDKNIRFYYQLSEDFEQRTVDFHDVELRLLELVKQIMKNELDMQYSDKMLEFCQNLQIGGVYQEYTDIYAGFVQANEELKNNKEKLVSKKYRFQLWESFKKHRAKIWRFILLLITIFSSAIILYETFVKTEKTESETPIRQIGTLIIKENQQTSATTATDGENK